MTPISTVAVLFWTMLVASSFCFARDNYLRAMLKAHWGKLALLLLLTLVWRTPADGVFFHGLEYEDSYIYIVVGRQMSKGIGPKSPSANSPYSTEVCEVGSLISCQQWERFPEHLIGYPYALSIFFRIFGYTPSSGSLFNLAISCITTLLIFLVALSITDDPHVASLAGLVFAITPVFAVYGLETSAEPFSNLLIILVVWLYLRLCDGDQFAHTSRMVTWTAYSAALLFSLSVKRENILLLVILPMMLPLMFKDRHSRRRERYLLTGLMIAASALAIILCVSMHLLQTSSGEVELFRRFPLTPQRLATFVGGFLRSFFIAKWYGGTVFAVGAGIVITCVRRRRSLLPVALLAAYILLYACHIRSYYEMESGNVEPQTALRFSMNVMALWAVVAGFGIGAILTRLSSSRVWNRNKRLSAWAMVLASFALFVVAFIATARLRNYEVEDEAISRLNPALSAINLASHRRSESDFVVTMEPLIVQMYAGPDTQVIDLESVSTGALRAMVSPDATAHLLFVKEGDRLSADDLNRYGEPVRFLLSLPYTVLRNNSRFQILAVNTLNSHHDLNLRDLESQPNK
ncbi:MAG: glycosyltransferase family 39 protein [Silvibacterium sp.]